MSMIAPCLSVEVETEQAEAGSHREGGGGEELLARVDLDLENKKIEIKRYKKDLDQGQEEAGASQLEQTDDDVGEIAVHVAARPLQHLVGVHVHRGDAGEEDEDDEAVEEEEGEEVLLGGAQQLQLAQHAAFNVVSFN